jgi:hypothetical protein
MQGRLGLMPKYYSALHKLLDDYGIYTIRELCRRTGLSSQQGWNLWHGQQGVGKVTAQKLHEACGIPYEVLMSLPPVSKPEPEPTPQSRPKPRLKSRLNPGLQPRRQE